MPIQSCQVNGKPGVKYGPTGKCYTYTKGDEESRKRAISMAERQGRAIEASKHSKG